MSSKDTDGLETRIWPNERDEFLFRMLMDNPQSNFNFFDEMIITFPRVFIYKGVGRSSGSGRSNTPGIGKIDRLWSNFP